jgi:hypothetical protein
MGEMYYDTVSNKLLWWNGTIWVDATGATGPTGPVGPIGYDTAPLGAIISTTRSTWGNEYVLANGQSLTEAAYPDAALVAEAEVAAGNTFWTISGTAPNRTFTVPDLRDRFLYSSGARAVGTRSQTNPAVANPGEETHKLLKAEGAFPDGKTTVAGSTGAGNTGGMSANNPHSHVVPRGTGGPAGSGAYSSTFDQSDFSTIGTDIAHTHSVPSLSIPALSINGFDAGGFHNNMPPYAVLVFIVKVRGVSTTATTITGPTGAQGPAGAAGAAGATGAAGAGVPVGGTTGQVLAKKTATDLDTEWVAQTGGSGGSATTIGANAPAGASTSVAANAAVFVLLPIGTPLTTATGTTDEFERQAEGSVLVKQAGWYAVTFAVSAPVQANETGEQYRICFGAGNTTPTVASTMVISEGSSPVPSDSVTFIGQIPANTRVALLAVNRDTVARSVQLFHFGIAKINGPKGDTGATGGNATVQWTRGTPWVQWENRRSVLGGPTWWR